MFKNNQNQCLSAYKKIHTRSMRFLELYKFNLSRRVQTRLNKKYVEQGYRQLAIFSFDSIGLEINYHGIYEKKELTCFFDWLSKLGIDLSTRAALDIGANIGNHSLYFSDYFQEVHSFEPNHFTYDLLSFNSKLVSNVSTYQFGLSDSDKQLDMVVQPQNIGASSIEKTEISQKASKHKRHISITLKKLDDLQLSDLPIELIKIDVEGHESSVLRGAKLTILKHQPIIIFEQLKSEISNGSSESIALLKAYGYQRFLQPSFSTTISKFLPSKIEKFFGNFVDECHEIRTIDYFESKTYPFIIAIPERLEEVVMQLKP